MKNSYESVAESWVNSELVAPDEVTVRTIETYRAEICGEPTSPHEFIENFSEMIGQCELSEYYTASSDVSLLSDLDDRCQNDLVGKEEKDKLSLLSDLDICQNELIRIQRGELLLLSADFEDRCQNYLIEKEDTLVSDLNDICQNDLVEKEERGERVIAGHVAAMRERFESMTRANTPCPDLARSCSPSLDVFSITPSPDNID